MHIGLELDVIRDCNGDLGGDDWSCDDGPPDCLLDCADIDNVADTDDGYAICTFLDPLWAEPNTKKFFFFGY